MPASDQGVSADRYRVIPRTLIFLFDQEDRVLLLKGAPDKRLWANKFNGIGGHIEPGEDVLSAARRELLEETGLASNDLWLCGSVMIDVEPDTGISLFVFKGTYLSGDVKESREGALFWATRDELEGLPLVEDLYSLLPVVWNTSRDDAPFSAQYFYDSEDRLVVTFADQD